MTDSPTPPTLTSDPTRKPATPLRCVLGSIVSGAISYVLWQLTNSIAISFARTPIHTDNMIVMRISTAIRTLVVGMSTLGTGIFGLACVGLIGLGIQLLFKKSPDLSTEKTAE